VPQNPSPRAEYERRLGDRQAAVDRLGARDARVSAARLVVFGIGVAIAVFAYRSPAVSAWWLLLPALAFLGLVAWHDRVLRDKARAERAVEFYRRGLARIDDRWMGDGLQRADFVDEEHTYASDLDLFGPGSLFELLCAARTRAGEETLARWIAAPAPIAVVRARQSAVETLRAKLDLREALFLLGGDLRAGVRTKSLTAWGDAAPMFSPAAAQGARLGALGLTGLSVLGLLLWAQLGLGPWLLGVALLLQWGVGRLLRGRLDQVTAPVAGRDAELKLLARVLARLEREPLDCPHLRELQAALSADGHVASRNLRRLGQLLSWHSAQFNQMFAPVAFLLMWNVHLSLAVEGWRVACGQAIGRWLEAVGEIEALSDLAGYAFEHPADPFPELLEDGPLIDGVDLGHPLIPAQDCVRNSVTLDSSRPVLLVSGSNMSGKTTLLRTVGVNVVLALAGAPVRATSLRLAPLQIGATLRIHDSIQKGTSRFYSEIRRLRQLMEAADAGAPLLFLLDEVLHGTNSHDRRHGAEGLIRGFLARGAIGLVTTHDLALAEIVDALGTRAANVHFADELEDGKLRFDYTMRDGVVKRSNALALMRSIGLEV